MVLELCDMDLQKLLELRSLSWETIKDFSCQLVRAIALLHEANVIHRDLKPQNILIRNIENKYTLKLCDFGTGRGETYSQIPQNLRRTTLCDVTTLFYCPPEGILDQHFSSLFGMASPRPASPPEVVSDYSNSVDCWALGCIVGEMVKRSPLFQGDGSGCDQLRLISGICGKPTPEETLHFPDTPAKKYLLGTPLGDAPSIDELFPCPGTAPVEEFENFKDFLKKLLVFDPKKRMTAREALEHPFISPTHSHYPPLPSVSPFCALNKMEQGGVSTDKWKGFLLTELDLYQKNRPALTISH
uniref:Protein kinase domain-containing protein n=1 Tax=Arcella intermedia TaxID=1963864 RepID=A0A6B2LBA5_9EUKA